MIELLQNVHFIRPEWFFALLPLAFLLLLARARSKASNGWYAYIAPELLGYLTTNKSSASRKNRWLPILCGWLLAVLGLAGPTWEKAPTPVYQSEAATVYILDLSPSMLAEDIKPNRETRAKQKIIDALNLQKDGLKALIVYSGEAHLVTPLTDDARTISSLVPSLSPRIMPLTGSNVEMAIELALTTLHQGNIQHGQIVLFTDGVDASAAPTVTSLLKNQRFPLHIISLGDENGAPIPIGQEGFAKDRQGNIIIAKNDRALLKGLAQQTQGRYSDIVLTDQDINFLTDTNLQESPSIEGQDRDFDQWQDNGYWLAWLLLPIVAFSFRRGAVFSFLLASPCLLGLALSLSLASPEAMANDSYQKSSATTSDTDSDNWKNLWLNKNQQGLASFKNNQSDKAATEFTDPRWKAASLYQAQDFTSASDVLKTINNTAETPSADDLYNQGNALAQSGQLQAALESYDKALALKADMADAIYNKRIVEELLKQQDQDQDQDKKQSGGDEKNNPQDSSKENESENSPNEDAEQSQDKPSDTKTEAGDESQNNDNPAQNDAANENEQKSSGDKDDTPAEKDGELGDYADSDNPTETDPNSEAAPLDNNPTAAENQLDKKPEEQMDQGQATIDAFDHLSGEEKEAMEQWLRQVNDDPSGLLKRKFEYQYRQRREAIKEGEWSPPENDAHTRW
ncbi:VWA domain-containing protein [Simiduia litorea]|uniref:VWA domain-containing protein n=1 Tax=Simiduia litorea TaxID=1435348 RepID=UPI0036F341C5